MRAQTEHGLALYFEGFSRSDVDEDVGLDAAACKVGL